jgi:hypothetical protein
LGSLTCPRFIHQPKLEILETVEAKRNRKRVASARQKDEGTRQARDEALVRPAWSAACQLLSAFGIAAQGGRERFYGLPAVRLLDVPGGSARGPADAGKSVRLPRRALTKRQRHGDGIG